MIESLADLMSATHDSAREFGLDDSTIMQVELAVEEAVVNIIKYAYPEDKGDVELSFRRDGGCLEIIISDTGIPFDATSREAPDIDAPLEERKVGGLGIFFVSQFMDEFLYERKDGKNVLTLRKKRAASP